MRRLFRYITDFSGIHVASVEDIYSFTGKVKRIITTEGEHYYLKEKYGISEIEQEYRLMTFLNSRGIPVALPIIGSSGLCYFTYLKFNYCIYPEIIGRSIEEFYRGDYVTQGEAIGRAIRRLHLSLKGYKKVNEFRETNLLKSIGELTITREAYFDKGFINQMKEELLHGLSGSIDILPKQLIHGDLHPGNMLFNKNLPSGYIDFDNAFRGVRIFDPCYCGISILEKGFKDIELRCIWIEIFAGLMRGYGISQLSKIEVNNLMNFLYSIPLIFMSYNITKGNIKAARENEEIIKWLKGNRGGIVEKIKSGI